MLCRTGDQVQAVARQLTDAGIPCQWVSRRILERPAVSKWLAAYRVATHQGGYADFIHLTDLGPTGISRETLGIFKRWAYARQLPMVTAMHSVHRLPIAHMSTARQKRLDSWVRFLERLQKACDGKRVSDALTHIVANTTLSSKLEGDDLDRMAELAGPYGAEPRAFCAALAVQRDTDLYRPGVEKVSVMTLHAAKGLEFPVVFIAGCEADLIPFRRPGRESVNTEEERRLFYVGMTRARRRLILTWSRRRSLFGQTHTQQISPFIQAIDPSIRRDIVWRQAPRKPRQEQLSLF